MNDKSKPGMGFEVNIRSATNDQKIHHTHTNADTPFCIAILGDFSGRFENTKPDVKPLAQRKLIEIDRDNFDDVLAGFKLSFNISTSDQSTHNSTIDIDELDDFHPDVLYENLEIFSQLRSIRRRLKNNASFDEAASEIMGWLVAQEKLENDTPTTPPTKPSQNISPENLLDNILDSSVQASSTIETIASPGGVDQLLKEIIAPYVEPGANPRQQEMLDAVDDATSEQMRQILHHPHFQSLEAAWRSVYFLISRVETGRQLKIYMLDVTKQELEQDLAGEVEASSMHKLFCEPAINDIPWSVLVGNYTFEDKVDDVLLLAQLGSIAQTSQSVFIGAAKETLAGCESFGLYPDADDWQYQIKSGVDSAWTMLRQHDMAGSIGLVLPRFLLRVPYGKKSRPIDTFKFEEMSGKQPVGHEGYLWGNAAFIKVEQLARAYAQHRWGMQPTMASQTDNLPMYFYEEDGVSLLLPCAEIYLTEKGGRKISGKGLMALWSMKNVDTIRSSDFNSLSIEDNPIKGRWIG